MLKVLRRILVIIYLLAVIPFGACFLSQYISPATFWPFAFFGLMFPAMIVLQIVFAIIFLILRSKAVILPVILIIVCWTPITQTFQIAGSSGTTSARDGTVKVMTYNVRLFDIAHYWSARQDPSDGIFAYIDQQKPDVLCFQEFAVRDSGKLTLEFVKSRLTALPYSSVEYNFTNQTRRHGLAIFSRYPIVATGHEHFSDTKNMMLYCDIRIGKDTVRVYNNHLESIHFDRDEFQWIDTTTNKMRIPRDKITEIVDRMKGAYIKRAVQADQVRKNIDSSPYKVIVCGDFNDTPVSYATHRIGSDLYDSFRSGGKWLGITFPNIRAPLRIDYILHSKEMTSSGYRIGKVKYSDHRPVSTNIVVRPT